MKYIPTLLGNLFFIVTGWFMVPIIYKLSDKGGKLKYLDRYYGNRVDTIYGDQNWQMNQAHDLGGSLSMRNVWVWAAWRNPAKNWHLRSGVSGTVNAVRLSGTWGRGRAKHEVTVSGEAHVFRWWVLKWPFANRFFELMLGPKIWPTVIEYGPDRMPLSERSLRMGDTIKNAAISFRIRPFIRRDWDAESVAKTNNDNLTV